MIPPDAGKILLPLARNAVANQLGRPVVGVENPRWLTGDGATFVTINLDQRLRGCIGSLVAHRPLKTDVEANALAAAFRDSRFRPLTAKEYPHVTFEVSVLSEPRKLVFTDRADALRQLRPGVDGVILRALGRRATYLPQVWQQLPDPDDFLKSLNQKAGLPADHWGPDVELSRYEVTSWREL